jgi:hypothetical protein
MSDKWEFYFLRVDDKPASIMETQAMTEGS